MIRSDSDEHDDDIDKNVFFDDNQISKAFIENKNLKGKVHEKMRDQFKRRIRDIFEGNVEGEKIRKTLRRLLLGIMSKD